VIRRRTPEQLATLRESVEKYREEHKNDDPELAYHIAKLERRAIEPWPRLSDDEQDWVHRRLEELSAKRAARQRAHEQRIISGARHLGREVAAHRVTLQDAERRLDALVSVRDDVAMLIPYFRAVAVARDAFAEGARNADTRC
jgi:hypothetical protein